MKVSVKYISRKFFDNGKIWNWVFSFRKFKHFRGFNIRLLGVHINVTEKDGLKNLKEKMRRREVS